jgi:LytS/YehU family sensor histidine kinase
LSTALPIHFLGAALLIVVWPLWTVVLRRALDVWGMGSASLTAELTDWTLTALPWSFLLYFAVLGCVQAFAYYAEARDRAALAAELQAQLAGARLDALQMQLHPHFLFNSLNAVLVLVRDEQHAAAALMIERLSGLLREVLESDHSHEVALSRELTLIGQYVGIEQVRFGDRLQVTYEIPDELRTAIVPHFILQPIVENAIRHGEGGQDVPTQVAIGATLRAAQLELWVRDDGGVPSQTSRGLGVGLENTRSRLATLYKSLASLTLKETPSGGTIALLRLPYRT